MYLRKVAWKVHKCLGSRTAAFGVQIIHNVVPICTFMYNKWINFVISERLEQMRLRLGQVPTGPKLLIIARSSVSSGHSGSRSGMGGWN